MTIADKNKSPLALHTVVFQSNPHGIEYGLHYLPYLNTNSNMNTYIIENEYKANFSNSDIYWVLMITYIHFQINSFSTAKSLCMQIT
jgi:hypothetical protein